MGGPDRFLVSDMVFDDAIVPRHYSRIWMAFGFQLNCTTHCTPQDRFNYITASEILTFVHRINPDLCYVFFYRHLFYGEYLAKAFNKTIIVRKYHRKSIMATENYGAAKTNIRFYCFA